MTDENVSKDRVAQLEGWERIAATRLRDIGLLQARMKDDELELKTLADQVIRLESEKQLLIEEGDVMLKQIAELERERDIARDLASDKQVSLNVLYKQRIEQLETAIQEFADDFPGYSPMWESVRQFARRALK